MPVSIFINDLIGDISKQAMMITTFVFGPRHLGWGLTPFDREVNRRLKLYKKWGLAYIEKKIQQAKNKLKTDGNLGPAEDIIEALVRAQAQS